MRTPSGVFVARETGAQKWLMFDDAARRLAAVGFKAARGDQEYREATPPGTVLAQDPRPGTKEPEGSTVTLTVSTNNGPPP